MSLGIEVFAQESYAHDVAALLADELRSGGGSVVLTGGKTVQPLYELLGNQGGDWSDRDVFFSDERCVPPEHEASNYGMTKRLLLDKITGARVHRMRGEVEPDEAARSYEEEVAPAVAEGIDLVLLGLGSDAHIAGIFPGSPVLKETSRLCMPVDRPFGAKGLTLTPPALWSGRRILVIAAGKGKADATRSLLRTDEPAERCPARLLAAHPDVTVLLDEAAGALL